MSFLDVTLVLATAGLIVKLWFIGELPYPSWLFWSYWAVTAFLVFFPFSLYAFVLGRVAQAVLGIYLILRWRWTAIPER